MLDVILQQILNGLVLGGVYALCAAGMALTFGVMQLPNFAHGQIYMLAAFAVYSLSAVGVDSLTAMVLSSVAFIGVGTLMRKSILFDLRDMTVSDSILVCMGLSMFLEGLGLTIWGPDYRQVPTVIPGFITIGRFGITHERVFIIFAAVVTLMTLLIIVFHTRLGRAMRATQQNRDAAETLGVNIERMYTTTFALGAFVTSIAAVLLAPIFSIEPYMGRPITMKSFAITVFGGMGSLKGAIVCGLLVGIVEVMGGMMVHYKYADLISYTIMIIVILFKPTGLFGRY